jgi:hypothetical protein
MRRASAVFSTKCSHFLTMYDRLPGLWLGLRLMDLRNGVHRSSAGQLNLSRRLQISERLIMPVTKINGTTNTVLLVEYSQSEKVSQAKLLFSLHSFRKII